MFMDLNNIALVHVIIHSGKVQYVEKWVKV